MSDETGKTDLPAAPLPVTRIPDAEPPETYADLGRDYPLALVAGGLAVGLIAGAVLPRGAGRKLAQGIATAAVAAGEIGLGYGHKAVEAASEGREKLKDLGPDTSQLRKKLGEVAGQSASAGKDLGRRLLLLAVGLMERM